MDNKEMFCRNKLVLYGLSIETERAINDLSEKYDIIGLLDGFKTSGEQFGYPIFSLDQVVQMDDVMIVVVARPGSCKAIVKRIGDVCRKNNIEVFDIRGNNLLESKQVVYHFADDIGYQYNDFLNAAKLLDAVSFDLFDTLVVRNVLSPTDIFELMKSRLVEMGKCIIDDYVLLRMAAEKQLSQEKAPRLVEIYDQMLSNISDNDISAETLADLEYEIDLAILESRKDSIRLLNELSQMGKKLFLTTDTYYSKQQIVEILRKNGINPALFSGILVSCEYGMGKQTGLFDKLIELAGTNNILHIGDDIITDYESAKKHNIMALRIYSSAECLDLLGGLGLSSFDEKLSDRIRVGMLMASLFNSPFLFENENKVININYSKEIGYLLCAPIMLDFVSWFDAQKNQRKLKNVWLCARDGYLIQKIFNILFPEEKLTYLLTSRIASIRAGVMNENDIHYVESMKYSGSTEENLLARFGISVTDIEEIDIDSNHCGLQKYFGAILCASEKKRKNNRKYIDTLNLEDGGIAFFDFVAKGTSQMFLQRLVDNHMTGFYFMQLDPEFMKSNQLDIISFYSEKEKDTSVIFNDYYILETILTSPEASVLEFTSGGKPIFAEETRSTDEINCIMEIQKGILEYADKYNRIIPKSERCDNKELDEAILSLIHHVNIRVEEFLNLKVEDPFFNRMTDVRDLL